VLDIWGEASSWEELQQAITDCPDPVKQPWLTADQSFRIKVEGHAFHIRGDDEIRAAVERFAYIPFQVGWAPAAAGQAARARGAAAPLRAAGRHAAAGTQAPSIAL
jgi:hypothetical protein